MNTADLLKLDAAHVWHPFTQMQGWLEDQPLIIERSEGNWLLDTDGRRWLDGISSLWVTVHGHRKKELDDAVRAQLDKVAHSTLLGMASVPSIELAARLAALTGLPRVFYSDSGSTSVEIAVKMAYQFWQLTGRTTKKRLVALKEAYHGDTIGSVSVGGMELFHERFRDLLFPVERVGAESLEALEKLFAAKHDELAGFVVEPLIQGAAGMLLQPRGWLKGVEALCRKYDVLLICDEVATGFGRTGKMFAVEHEGVTPDLMCVAKGLTGGYLPLAATLASERVYRAFLGRFDEAKTFFHGHTYTGNPLACAVALANLELFEREKTLEKMKPVEALLADGLAALAKLPTVREVRRRGFMIGVEVQRADGSAYEFGERMGFRVCTAARADGVLLRPLGNVVVLMPPLSLSVDEAKLLLRATRSAIERTCGA
jgi:adenosylmethionine-8-amino-7-oxononanoate aminotransferase